MFLFFFQKKNFFPLTLNPHNTVYKEFLDLFYKNFKLNKFSICNMITHLCTHKHSTQMLMTLLLIIVVVVGVVYRRNSDISLQFHICLAPKKQKEHARTYTLT